MKEIVFIVLAAFAIIPFVVMYIVAYYKAKKFCKYYHYDFKKFWFDELTKGVDTSNPYVMEQYRIKEDRRIMTKNLFEQEFVARCQSKMAGLSKDDCPYTDEEYAAYKEGWLAAWQWSIDILAKMMRETKDLTDE